ERPEVRSAEDAHVPVRGIRREAKEDAVVGDLDKLDMAGVGDDLDVARHGQDRVAVDRRAAASSNLRPVELAIAVGVGIERIGALLELAFIVEPIVIRIALVVADVWIRSVPELPRRRQPVAVEVLASDEDVEVTFDRSLERSAGRLAPRASRDDVASAGSSPGIARIVVRHAALARKLRVGVEDAVDAIVRLAVVMAAIVVERQVAIRQDPPVRSLDLNEHLGAGDGTLP